MGVRKERVEGGRDARCEKEMRRKEGIMERKMPLDRFVWPCILLKASLSLSLSLSLSSFPSSLDFSVPDPAALQQARREWQLQESELMTEIKAAQAQADALV